MCFSCRPRPDPDSCSQNADTLGGSKTDTRDDSEIQTGSYSADQWSGKIAHKKCCFEKCVCFGFLDTSVIVWWLNGSALQGRKAIEALPVCSCVYVNSSSMFPTSLFSPYFSFHFLFSYLFIL